MVIPGASSPTTSGKGTLTLAALDDLIERLREQHRVGILGLPDDFKFVNYGEAASALSALQERVRELEGGLAQIAAGMHHPQDLGNGVIYTPDAASIARTTLERK